MTWTAGFRLGLVPMTALFAVSCSQDARTVRLMTVGAPSYVLSAAPGESKPVEAKLVDIGTVVPDAIVRLAYKTNDNITGAPLYPPGMPALLHPITARKLKRAATKLRRDGFRLVIWDAYRPPEAHLRLWAQAPGSGYVADPNDELSRHCSGTAVDVTLAHADGSLVSMPTGFDDFSHDAHSIYDGRDASVRRHLRILQKAMAKSGFTVLMHEWWHFADETITASPTNAAEMGLRLPGSNRDATRRD